MLTSSNDRTLVCVYVCSSIAYKLLLFVYVTHDSAAIIVPLAPLDSRSHMRGGPTLNGCLAVSRGVRSM